MKKEDLKQENSSLLEGRNPVLEAYRAGKTVDKLYILDGSREGSVLSIVREARKQGTLISFVKKEQLDRMSQTGAHQGVIAQVAAYKYAEVEDILNKAENKGEAPFIFILDEIEDPHNLGSMIRTADLCGAHGVIIPKRRSAGITPAAAKASAGAVNYVPVAKVSNIASTVEELKKKGIWAVCAAMAEAMK